MKTNLETNTTAITNGTKATQPAIFCIKIIGTIGRFLNFDITTFNEYFNDLSEIQFSKINFLIIAYFRNGGCKRTQEEEGNAEM